MRSATNSLAPPAYFVYILECADGTFYAGYTRDLQARLLLHNAGRGAKYMRGRGPARIVYSRGYQRLTSALRAEIRLKKLTRPEKARLVAGYARRQRRITCRPA